MVPFSKESSRLLLSLVQKRCAQKTLSENERTQLRSVYDILLSAFTQKNQLHQTPCYYTRRIKQNSTQKNDLA